MSYLFNYYAKSYDSFMKFFKLDNQNTILELLSDQYNRNICDIGGGTGVLAEALIKRGHQVTIIDPSVQMTSIAKMRNKNIAVINKPIQEVDFIMEFDFIIFKDTFHHISEQKEVLAKCYDMLKKGGQVIIQDFSPKSVQTKIIFLFETCCFEKIYPIIDTVLAQMMDDIGYKGTVMKLSKRDYIVTGDRWSNEQT